MTTVPRDLAELRARAFALEGKTIDELAGMLDEGAAAATLNRLVEVSNAASRSA